MASESKELARSYKYDFRLRIEKGFCIYENVCGRIERQVYMNVSSNADEGVPIEFIGASLEQEWELEQRLEPEEIIPLEFDYYYELTDSNPYQESFSWHEMSHYHEHTSWDALEKTELELYEEEESIL